MAVKQISVFVENKTGQLAEFMEILAQNKIDMRAMSIAETRDFGILRIIVDDPERTAAVLKDAGCVFSIREVLAVAIPDEPGSLARILHILGENGIGLAYSYAFITRKASLAYVIVRTANDAKAEQVFAQHGIQMAAQEELYKL